MSEQSGAAVDFFHLSRYVLQITTSILAGAALFCSVTGAALKDEHLRTEAALSAVVVGVAAYHYQQLLEELRSANQLGDPITKAMYRIRTSDWIVTLPIMAIETRLILTTCNVVDDSYDFLIYVVPLLQALVPILGAVASEFGSKNMVPFTVLFLCSCAAFGACLLAFVVPLFRANPPPVWNVKRSLLMINFVQLGYPLVFLFTEVAKSSGGNELTLFLETVFYAVLDVATKFTLAIVSMLVIYQENGCVV
jgi:bacteriorhodopsin